jgi:AraC-like DNA-binding protein
VQAYQILPLKIPKPVHLYTAKMQVKGGKNANETSYQVGYNSPAQFSREYKVPSAT